MSRHLGIATVLILAAAAPPAIAAPLSGPEGVAVSKAIQFLSQGIPNANDSGEIALAALAIVKAESGGGNPAVSRAMSEVMKHFSGTSYSPHHSGGTDIYEVSIVGMLLCNLDPKTYKPQIDSLAQYLMRSQKANGSWDYTQRNFGDTSISQYAVLGLWELSNAGANVPPEVFDRAAGWFMSVQSATGSWNYHRDETFYPETISMTAAGAGSLLICNSQLAQFRKAGSGDNLLTPLVAADAPTNQKYTPQNSPAAIEGAARRGLAWLGSNFTVGTAPVVGQSGYYALYGLERVGALAGSTSLGGHNWFEEGKSFALSTQQGNGSWSAQHGVLPNTSWGILFLTKSTAKSVEKHKINRLGAGTLLGGRGLPKDLSSLTVAGGRIVVRPMNGAVEGMLSVLEDPKAEDADAALAGLVGRYDKEGPKVLRPYKDRFRKLLTDRDPGVRQVAAWALGHTGDLDTAPILISALKDPDDGVVRQARISLQLISRKIDGFGPLAGATPAQKQEAAQRWREWYNSVRPIGQDSSDDVPAASPPR